jgi:hypothetical protein
MADTQQQQPSIQLPTRVITITGERVARLTSTTIRVSRIEQKFLNMSMSTAPRVRDAVGRVSDRYNQAFARFEAELKEIEGDLENSNRDGNNGGRRGNQSDRGNQRPAGNKGQVSRDAKTAGQSQANNNPGKGQATAQQPPKGQDGGRKPKAEAGQASAPTPEAKSQKDASKPAPAHMSEAIVATASPVTVPVTVEPVAAPAPLESL